MSQSGSFGGGGNSPLNVQTLTGNTGGVVSPTGNNINLLGDGIVTVDGDPTTSTVAVNVSGKVATTYGTDSGTAEPDTNNLNIIGDSVITTSAFLDTVTIDMVNGTDGQLLIGGGTEATWANLTSADGSVTITEGPNSIDLQVAGGGGGVATITAGANITTTVAGSDVTVAVTDRIDLPATNSAKTQGVLAIGDCEFFTYGIDEDEPNSNIFIGQNMPSTAGIDDTVKGVVCIGSGAMGAATTVQDGAVAIGYKAMENGDSSGTIAIGSQAMRFGIADNGIAIGELAMSGGGGQDAIAIGTSALGSSANCDYSIAMGHQSMLLAGSGITNAVSIGFQAMGFPGSGGNSAIAIGKAAMSNAGGGEAAIAMGDNAMQAGGGIDAIAIGRNAMLNGGGADDIAIGRDAMRDAGAGGGDAIAIGHQAMQAVTGINCIAIGHDAMRVATSSTLSTSIAIGHKALETVGVDAVQCIAIGQEAMKNAEFTGDAIAIGINAMRNASSNSSCIAIGRDAMVDGGNFGAIAIGNGAMTGVGAGGSDSAIAIGSFAMSGASAGGAGSIAIGSGAMDAASGDYNIAIGDGAMGSTVTRTESIAIGTRTMNNDCGSYCIGIGYQAGNTTPTTSDYCIYINSDGSSSDPSGTIRIGGTVTTFDDTFQYDLGPTFIGGIRGVTTNNNDAVAVLIDSAGQLGTVSSSIRYKENVQTLGEDSAVLHKLRAVSFTYKNRPADRKEYGFIAEEVLEHIPDIVVYNKEGEPETIQYHKLYGLMVSEIQQNRKKIEALEQRLAALEARLST